ncbi:protein LURP-one-related 8-like [Mangifera indica]|uniref:protein LURP-one-related 8-like n=1 Tax=Mangifera indica TaxID=29780 RepID=UPI001CF969A6|nr:protein LURP-one-related 8-like [Mangifera indica]
MTKVHPNAAVTLPTATMSTVASDRKEAVLTVWKKSLLFNCNGFTVYDGKGDLVFRVDNYMQGHKGEILLMDAAGKPLLTIRRKRLSLGDNWLVYDGETVVNPLFSVRKNVNILNNKSLAQVSRTNCEHNGTGSSSSSNNKNMMMYEIEGSYAQRCCAVYDGKRRVAEIKQKEAVGGVAFGVDVFRLIVQPEIDTSVAMAIVILLDKMFGSSRRFSS